MASILDLFPQDPGDPLYYDPSIINVLENFLPTLLASSQTQIVTIQPAQAREYDGDFYGLLTFLKYEQRYWYIILRLNNMTSPWQYSTNRPMAIQDMLTILVPSTNEIDTIIQAENVQGLTSLT